MSIASPVEKSPFQGRINGAVVDFLVDSAASIEAGLSDQCGAWIGTSNDFGSEYAVPLAQTTHYEGYVREGLAKPNTDGSLLLSEGIDKSRSIGGIEYLLRFTPKEADLSQYKPGDRALSDIHRATARLSVAQSLLDLPTYELTQPGMDMLAKKRISRLFKESNVSEVGALAASHGGHSRESKEILRDLMNLTVGNNRKLFVSMVTQTRQYLANNLSEENFSPIGGEVLLPENEYRPDTVLVPIIIDPDKFVANLFNKAIFTEDPLLQGKLAVSSLFFAEKAPESVVPDELLSLRGATRERAGGDYA